MANGTTQGGLSSLLNNKLLLQYLAAAGQDIGSGSQLGTNVNQVTNQAITAQNYAKLLRGLLSNGGKVSMDSENVSIKAPAKAFEPGATGQAIEQNVGVPTSPTTPTRTADQNSLLSSLLLGGGAENPSASPLGIGEIPASDLAGLTPKDISSALRFKFAQEEMSQQKARDAVDRLYKLSQISQGQAATEIAQSKELRAWEELFRNAPLEVPGLGQLSLETWEKLPTDVKAYSYYAFTATQAGEDVLSYNEFKQQADPSSLVQYYNLAKEDPEFKKFYFESKKAGATKISIGEKVEQKKALSWVDFQNNLAKDVSKFKESEAFQDAIFEYEPGTPEESDAKALAVADYVENQLLNRGRVVGKELTDEGVMTWTIVTNTGKVETIRYDLFK